VPVFLDSAEPGFEARFAAFLGTKRETDADLDAEVAGILAEVAARGDAAVIEMTARWDRLTLTPATLAVSAAEIDAAAAAVDPADRAALELAAERIAAYHARQRPEDARWTDATGAELGWRWTPVGAAGLYVPGGLASYPSSVLMNAIPARVAGVGRLAICAPAPDGALNPLVLLAARLAGVTAVYRIGGAQAIAALAYGTETIAPVDKIVGPGNAWVAAATRRVFGRVGIDMIAGPSEILVIADATAEPEAVVARIRHAGAIFVGALTPEAIGDYVGGPNHVLPTARSARFSSGLSVLDFMKRTTIARMTPAALAAIGPAAERLAMAEGLEAHGLSVRARLDRLNEG
jgi:histidinol dehydrogenase